MATESGKDDRDSDAELAVAVHRVFAILTDLRTDAPTPALRERIALVQWLRSELSDVETFLNQAAVRRESAPAPTPAPASSPASGPAPASAAAPSAAG